MKFSIEKIPPYRLAYKRQIGPYGEANREVMESLKKWAKDNHLLTESAIILGIPQDHPEHTPPNNCRYDACIVVSDEESLNDEVEEGSFSSGDYAVFKIRHTAEALEKGWEEIFQLLQSGELIMDSKPIIERYSVVMLKEHFCEICVPIVS